RPHYFPTRRSSDLTTCRGAGKVKKNSTIKVSIPAGIDEGQQIRLLGKGEPGKNGGPAGDLFVDVRVNPHEYFQREGDNIYLEVPITIAQAELEDEVEVQTVHGAVNIKVPAGTQTGKTFRIRGKGAPNVRGYGQGEQHVKIRVVTPTKLTSRQKELLKEFNQLDDNTPISEEEDTIFKRFKKAFKGE